ncbi:MAG: tetratricopeptide repeat protein [Hyphomicrobiaceae bacterium]
MRPNRSARALLTCRWAGRVRFRAVACTLGFLVSGCASSGFGDAPGWDGGPITGSLTAMTTQGSSTGTADQGAVSTGFANESDALRTIRQSRRSGGGAREAFKVADAAVKQFPGALLLRQERGLLAVAIGETETAEQDLEAVIAGGAGDWRTHSALGVAKSTLGKHDAARAAFRAALKASRNNKTVLNNYAMAEALAGNRDRAEDLLRQAQVSGGDPRHAERVATNLAMIATAGPADRASVPRAAPPTRQATPAASVVVAPAPVPAVPPAASRPAATAAQPAPSTTGQGAEPEPVPADRVGPLPAENDSAIPPRVAVSAFNPFARDQ